MLCPDTWKTYSPTHAWQGEKLDSSRINQIPDAPGVYTLILQPGIAEHPACSYLMYVGKAKSLRRRFRDYLTSEKLVTGRPRIFIFLNLYEGFIFYYTPVKMEALKPVEDSLTDAYQPPLNTEVKGTFGTAKEGVYLTTNSLPQPLVLAAFRANMGDWIYYISYMKMQEIAKRVHVHRRSMTAKFLKSYFNETLKVTEHKKSNITSYRRNNDFSTH